MPSTYSFLRRFETQLRSRRPFRNFQPARGPFYGLYNVGHYTFSPYKVVWREIAADFIVAPVDPTTRPNGSVVAVVRNHKLMVVPVETQAEAMYLAGVLSSTPARYFVLSYTVSTQISTHVLQHLAVPSYAPQIMPTPCGYQLCGAGRD